MGVYICEEIMTLAMVRRRKKDTHPLMGRGAPRRRLSISHRTLWEVLWLEGA